MAKRGKSKSTSISVSISERDRRALKKLAEGQNKKHSAIIREAIDALLEKERYAPRRELESPATRPQLANLQDAVTLGGVARIAERRAPEFHADLKPESVRIFHESVRAYDGRARITTNVEPQIKDALEQLAASTGRTKAEIVRDAIEYLVAEEQQKTTVTPSNNRVVIRSTQHVIIYSRLIITAIEETLEHSEHRRHNQPPPAMMIEDSPEYLQELRSLVSELKRLNDNMEAVAKIPERPRRQRASRAAEKSAIDVKKHLNTFLDRYAKHMAVGAAALTTAAAGALMMQLGVSPSAILNFLKELKK